MKEEENIISGEVSQNKKNEQIEESKERIDLLSKINELEQRHDFFLSFFNNSDAVDAKKLSKFFSDENVLRSLESLVTNKPNARAYILQQVTALLFDYISNKDLRQCTVSSIFAGFKKIIALGLRYGKEYREAVLVKGYNIDSKTYEAQFRDMYKAYINSVYDNLGWVTQVNLVTKDDIEQDLFEYDSMTNSVLKHKWSIEASKIKSEDNIVGAYVICKNKENKVVHSSQLFTVEELKERAKQKKKDNTIWYGEVWNSKVRKTDFSEMVKKTAIRLWAKTMPSSNVSNIFELSNEPENIKFSDSTEITQKQQKVDYSDVDIEFKC